MPALVESPLAMLPCILFRISLILVLVLVVLYCISILDIIRIHAIPLQPRASL